MIQAKGKEKSSSCESFYFSLVLYIFPRQFHATPILAVATGICMLILLLVLAALNVLVSDVLPLAASVVAVPDVVHGGVETDLPSEAGTEDGRKHGEVLAEHGAVDRLCERHVDFGEQLNASDAVAIA